MDSLRTTSCSGFGSSGGASSCPATYPESSAIQAAEPTKACVISLLILISCESVPCTGGLPSSVPSPNGQHFLAIGLERPVEMTKTPCLSGDFVHFFGPLSEKLTPQEPIGFVKPVERRQFVRRSSHSGACTSCTRCRSRHSDSASSRMRRSFASSTKSHSPSHHHLPSIRFGRLDHLGVHPNPPPPLSQPPDLNQRPGDAASFATGSNSSAFLLDS